MIVKKGHPLFGKVKVVCINGSVIDSAFYYNTKTKTTKLYIKDSNGKVAVVGKRFMGSKSEIKKNKVLSVTVKIPGSKLICKETGKELK